MQHTDTIHNTPISEPGYDPLQPCEAAQSEILSLQEMEFTPDPSDMVASESTASMGCDTNCCCWC